MRPHLARVLNVAGTIHLDYYWRTNHKPIIGPSIAPIKWLPPPLGWYKIKFDGSMRCNHAAIRFVIRDDNAHVVLAGAKKIGRNSIIVAECLTLRDDLAYAVSKGWSKLLVEGDSKLVIDLVLKRCSTP
ncbi:unnamed protein product [Prunus armeniaca]